MAETLNTDREVAGAQDTAALERALSGLPRFAIIRFVGLSPKRAAAVTRAAAPFASSVEAE